MPKPFPFLWFHDRAEEAAALYTGLFPNSRITGVARRPPGSPDSQTGEVLTVSFSLDGQDFVALNGATTSPSTRPSRSRSSARIRPRSTATGTAWSQRLDVAALERAADARPA